MRRIIYTSIALLIVAVATLLMFFNIRTENIDISKVSEEISMAEENAATQHSNQVQGLNVPRLYVSETLPNFDNYSRTQGLRGYKISSAEFREDIEEGRIRFTKQNPAGKSAEYGAEVPIIENNDTTATLVESPVSEVDSFMANYNIRFNMDNMNNTVGLLETAPLTFTETTVNLQEVIAKYRPEISLPIDATEMNVSETFGITIGRNTSNLPVDGNFEVNNAVTITTSQQQNYILSIYSGTVIEYGQNYVSIDCGDFIVEYKNLGQVGGVSGEGEVVERGTYLGEGQLTPEGATFSMGIKLKQNDVYINPMILY